MATLDDVVGLSGFSRSTVFRYLRGKPVRRAAKEAIRTALEETGYQIRARDTGEKTSVPIGISLSLPSDFRGFRGYGDIVQAIMTRAEELGIPVQINAAMETDRHWGVIIVGKTIAEEDEERATLDKFGIPCVLVNRMIHEKNISWVSVDIKAAAMEAVQELARADCRHISCYYGSKNYRVENQKIEGFLHGARERGLIATVYTPDQGTLEEVLNIALQKNRPRDGWFATSDEEAMRVIRYALSLGREIPTDFAVVGINDLEGAAYFVPSITSIHIPFKACGKAAVDALRSLIENPLETSVQIYIKHHLVERESCIPKGQEGEES